MAVLDAGIERSNSFTEWLDENGASAALLGCSAFWAIFGIAAYFIL